MGGGHGKWVLDNVPSNNGPFGWLLENENGEFETKTLDSLFCNDNIASIKLDVEGSELLAIEGSKEILKQKPIMIVEVNGFCLMQKNKNSNDLLRLINNNGYEIFIENRGELLKVNPDIFFPFCVMDVICIPTFDALKIEHGILEKNTCNHIYEQIKNNMNENCKEYFEYIKK